jgi:hypothetical protein
VPLVDSLDVPEVVAVGVALALLVDEPVAR